MCESVCMSASMYFLYVCIYTCMYLCTHIHTQIYIHTHTYMYMNVRLLFAQMRRFQRFRSLLNVKEVQTLYALHTYATHAYTHTYTCTSECQTSTDAEQPVCVRTPIHTYAHTRMTKTYNLHKSITHTHTCMHSGCVQYFGCQSAKFQ
jgi:hypothetical protein